MKNSNLKYYILAILAMFFWALTFIWFKTAIKYWEPITIIFIRLLIAAILLFLFTFFAKIKIAIKRTDIKFFILISFAEPFMYFIGESFGLKYVSSTISAVIISTIPLFTSLAAIFFLKEKPSVKIFSGIAISILGILIMVLNSDYSFNAEPKGIALLFLAVISAVAFTLLVQKVTSRYNPVTILVWQNSIAVFLFLPLFLIFDFQSFIKTKVNFELVITILKLSIFASILAFLFFIIVIEKIGAMRSNIFSYLIPIFTSIAAFFILNEDFTPQKIIGIILVLFGVGLSQNFFGLLKTSKKNTFNTKP